MSVYYNCSKCGLCLSDCLQYQSEKNAQITPKGVLLTLHKYPRQLSNLRKECLKYCNSDCKGLKKCPMSIDLSDYLRGELEMK